MSSVAKIDQNDKPTILAYNETTHSVETVYVDPITNALYVYAVLPDANDPTSIVNARIDQNDNATALGYNETTGLTDCLRCTSDGELLIIPQ